MKTKDLKLIELQCKGIISSIKLFNIGVEKKEDIEFRIISAINTWNIILKGKEKDGR